MVVVSDDLAWLVAREQIRDCIVRIARAEDRRDGELIRRCYWPDARLDFGIFRGDFEQYLAWIVPGSPAVPVTQHVLGQTLIALEGEAAVGETHVLSYHRIDPGGEARDMLIGGRYLDRLERRHAEWRIVQRDMLYDWSIVGMKGGSRTPSPPSSWLELTRFCGHPETRETARGVFHGTEEAKSIYTRVQGGRGALVPRRRSEYRPGRQRYGPGRDSVTCLARSRRK